MFPTEMVRLALSLSFTKSLNWSQLGHLAGTEKETCLKELDSSPSKQYGLGEEQLVSKRGSSISIPAYCI